MGAFVHAVEVFFGHLSSIAWTPLALAIGCHLAKMACRSRAWSNILAAAYPNVEVRWRDVAGAYAAGVGVNALLPARGGDIVKLYLVKRRIPGATYPTLASTFLVEMVFDVAAALVLLGWAIQQGVLPGLDVLPNLPALDLSWIIDHPFAFTAIAVPVAVVLGVLGWKASRHVVAFRRRLAQGFAVLGDWKRYLATVAGWQAADWFFRLATIYFFLHAFGIGVGIGLEGQLRSALLVQVTQSLSALIPFTPSGIGTEQALVVYVFAGKVSTGALISFSVGMQLVLVVVNVAVGFGAMLLMLRTFRWRRHIQRTEAPVGTSVPPLRVAETTSPAAADGVAFISSSSGLDGTSRPA